MLCGQIKISGQRGQRMINFEKITKMNIEEMSNYLLTVLGEGEGDCICCLCSKYCSKKLSESCEQVIKRYLESEAVGGRMTNFEKIKNMSIEEMFDFFKNKYRCEFCALLNHCGCTWERDEGCKNGLHKYLRQEAE